MHKLAITNKIIEDDINEPKLMSSTSESSFSTTESVKKNEHHNGFREDYVLGDVVRTPADMIIEPTPEQARQYVASLEKHDFAFVKRSDSTYTYAIVSHRSDDYIFFVMCESCFTKKVSKKRWDDFIRRPSRQERGSMNTSSSKSGKQKKRPTGEGACNSSIHHYVSVDDESSVVSDVSMPLH